MTSGESPQFLFDIVMSRFPADYSPSIVYDNACKFKEYGLNRETQRFMELQITVDKFHQCNHTSCGESFESSESNRDNQDGGGDARSCGLTPLLTPR